MAKKPTFAFQFPSQEAAETFLHYANEHSGSTLAQHPVSNSIADKKRVLVRGTGSNVYDYNMRCDLVEKARSLGGDVVPKHTF